MSFPRRFHPILIFVLLFAGSPALYAQHIITGKVNDKAGTAIPFASVLLQQLPDSGLLATTITDSLGNYKLNAAKLSKTILTAGGIGYKPAVKLMEIDKSITQSIDFVLEEDAIELKEASVSSRKPLIEHKVDRVIFNVENSISAIGTDALDAMSKAPGVLVSGSDDITLAGKSSVSVMLNDKLIQLSGDELAEMLHSIPSDNISRIEVITTPPAKYDAAGNSGIINIVTRKTRRDGLNGTVGFTYRQNNYGSFQPTGTFNYRKQKWNLYGNTNGGENYSKPTEKHTSYYPTQTLVQSSDIKNLHNYHRSQLGADYNITPKAVIGFLYTYGGSTPKMWEDISGKWVNRNNGIDSVINTKAHTSDFGERNVANANYEWSIDSSGKKLNIDGDFFTRTGRTVRDFNTIDMLGDGTMTGVTSSNKSTGKQVLYISSIKADMELPLTTVKLSFGGKASFIHVISDNVFQYLDHSVLVTDTGKTNKFDYRENTQAIYTSAQRKINEKWELQAGLRAEYTQSLATSITTKQANERKYLQLFPTAYVQYTHNDDHVFSLNFSRRIERPNMSQINPFRRYMTPNTYDEGNPFLQPSFSSNLEGSYTLKSKYTFTVYGQYNQQIATQILEVDSVLKGFHFRYANIGQSINYGFNASAALQPAKWWECNMQFYGFHASVYANYYNGAVTNNYSRTGFVTACDNSFTLNSSKTLMAEIGFEYQGKMIDNYDLHYPSGNLNAGFRALFYQKSLIVGINLDDMLATEVHKSTNLYNGSTSNNYYDTKSLHLNVTYKFGSKNVKSKREHSGGATEESKRA